MRESLPANSRWIFGVEPKTQTEKSKSGYNLKVPYILFSSGLKENDDYLIFNHRLSIKNRSSPDFYRNKVSTPL